MIRGHKATLTMAGNKVDLNPERPFVEEIEPQTSETFKGETYLTSQKLVRQHPPEQAAECRHRSGRAVQTVISLAEMSERLNIMCLFDEKTRKITTGDGREVKPITYGSMPLS